jgi:WD40 repeat protein
VQKEISQCDTQTHEIHTMSWNPADAGQLMLGMVNGSVAQWDPRASRVINTRRVHRENVSALSWNDIGSHYISASCDQTLKLWDCRRTELPLQIFEDTRATHDGGDYPVCVAWNPQSPHVFASGSNEGTITYWCCGNDTNHGSVHRTSFETLLSSPSLFGQQSNPEGRQSNPEGRQSNSEGRQSNPEGRPGNSNAARSKSPGPDALSGDAKSETKEERLTTAGAFDPEGLRESKKTSQVLTTSLSEMVVSPDVENRVRAFERRKTSGSERKRRTLVTGDVPRARRRVAASTKIGEMAGAHCGRVSDIVFHPEGHVLCSVGGDATLKFWSTCYPDADFENCFEAHQLPPSRQIQLTASHTPDNDAASITTADSHVLNSRSIDSRTIATSTTLLDDAPFFS